MRQIIGIPEAEAAVQAKFVVAAADLAARSQAAKRSVDTDQ